MSLSTPLSTEEAMTGFLITAKTRICCIGFARLSQRVSVPIAKTCHAMFAYDASMVGNRWKEERDGREGRDG